MLSETSPVVANLISSVLSEMLDENGRLKRKATDCSPCCCEPGCFMSPDPQCRGPIWPEG